MSELSHLAGPGQQVQELAGLADIHMCIHMYIKVGFRARAPCLCLVRSQLRLSAPQNPSKADGASTTASSGRGTASPRLQAGNRVLPVHSHVLAVNCNVLNACCQQG